MQAGRQNNCISGPSTSPSIKTPGHKLASAEHCPDSPFTTLRPVSCPWTFLCAEHLGIASGNLAKGFLYRDTTGRLCVGDRCAGLQYRQSGNLDLLAFAAMVDMVRHPLVVPWRGGRSVGSWWFSSTWSPECYSFLRMWVD